MKKHLAFAAKIVLVIAVSSLALATMSTFTAMVVIASVNGVAFRD